MWIARDKDGGLYLYSNTPRINHYRDTFKAQYGSFFSIDSHLLPEVTFENSPQEVEIKLKTK